MTDAWTTFPTPKQFKLPRKLKVVIAVMVVCALAGLAGLASKSKPASTQSGPKYVGFATLVVDNYVAGHAVNVPTATGLNSTLGRLSAVASGAVQANITGTQQTNDSTVQPLPIEAFSFYSGKDTTAGKDTLETDTFLLEYTDGSLQGLDVVIDGTSSGPELAALPALVPAPADPPAETPAGAPVPVASLDSPLPSGLQFRVNQWATAYATDDETTLYQVTGDTQSRTYLGLGGFTVVGQPTITASTQDGPRLPDQLIVTVELTLQSATNVDIVEQVAYDLLITGVSNKYPDIVAWGPSGSGSTLVPFENAS